MGADFPISLTIKAIDKATEPLRAINAKVAAFNAPFAKLGHAFKEFGEVSGLTKLGERTKEVGHAFKEVGKEAVELGEKLLEMEVVGVFAIYEIMKSSVEAGAKLSEMAQRTGLSVNAYSQLQFAAGQAHVNQEQFNDAMDKFNKSLGEAKAGGGPLLEFLQKVSPALAQQVKGAESTEAAFGLMAKAFEKLEDPSKIAALNAAAFGRGVKNMGQFLHQGSAEIGKYRARGAQLIGDQELFVKRSEEAEKAINETSTAFAGLRNAATTGLMPALSGLATKLADFMAANREGLAKWAESTGIAITAWVEGGGLQRLGDSLSSIATTIGGVVDMLGGLKGVATIVGLYMAGPFVGSLVNLAGALFGVQGATLKVVAGFGRLVLGPIIASIATFTQALWLGFSAMEAVELAFAPALIAIAPFALAIAGLSAAVYELYIHWADLKKIFHEGITWGKSQKEIDAKAAELGQQAIDRRHAAEAAGRPMLGAAQAAPGQSGAGSAQQTQATVKVDFSNVPKGVRVSQDPNNTAPVDTSLGYTMWSPF